MTTDPIKLTEEVLDAVARHKPWGDNPSVCNCIATDQCDARILATALIEAEKEIDQLRELYRARPNGKLTEQLVAAQKRIAELEADRLHVRAQVYRHGLHSLDPYETPEYVDPWKDPEMRPTVKSFVRVVLERTREAP